MKLLTVVVLVLATTACTAQQAPVNIALDIYQSCLLGFTQAKGFPKSNADIRAQSIDFDKACTQWTYAWLPPFLNKPSLSLSEDLLFRERKANLIAAYTNDLKYFSTK